MQNPKKLDCYNKSYEFSKKIIELIEPIRYKNQRLYDQLFGSSTSVPANLMEFGSMETTQQKANKLRICIGEANESEMWLDLLKDMKHIDEQQHKDLMLDLKIIRMALFNLLKRVKEDDKNAIPNRKTD